MFLVPSLPKLHLLYYSPFPTLIPETELLKSILWKSCPNSLLFPLPPLPPFPPATVLIMLPTQREWKWGVEHRLAYCGVVSHVIFPQVFWKADSQWAGRSRRRVTPMVCHFSMAHSGPVLVKQLTNILGTTHRTQIVMPPHRQRLAPNPKVYLERIIVYPWKSWHILFHNPLLVCHRMSLWVSVQFIELYVTFSKQKPKCPL